ncbi:hypothetical protein [Variovorax sp. YR216]|uniref:hypothetical protein n=1 Tax=Variovorax sp. YR216 TaxID=1882828 RepID=UPI000B80F30B|nr:hypothetical protein [Variovorax sp. YR216]
MGATLFDRKKDKPVADEDNKLLLEELKLCSDDYQHRNQLIVTEFALSITAFGVSLSAANGADGWSRLLVYVGLALFLTIVAHHMVHVNQVRLEAAERVEEIKQQLEFRRIHGGYTGKRKGIKIPAPKAMVWFV